MFDSVFDGRVTQMILRDIRRREDELRKRQLEFHQYYFECDEKKQAELRERYKFTEIPRQGRHNWLVFRGDVPFDWSKDGI